MPRSARKKSESGIYHIILRGHNKQSIFNDDEDKEKFLDTLTDCRKKSGFKIYGYCLMTNHIHLLIHELNEDLGIIMRRIGASYVYWYNWKYKRCGHLFQDRFRSEAVENDAYFYTVLRYIHHNPVKAGIVRDYSDYEWSSYNDYLKNNGIANTEFALRVIDDDRHKAIEGFVKYHHDKFEDQCLEIEDNFRMTDDEADEIIKRICGISSIQLKDLEKETRNDCIARLRREGLSTRQIERLTGLSRMIILYV
jgi:REP element-mobilizing transposase RayT